MKNRSLALMFVPLAIVAAAACGCGHGDAADRLETELAVEYGRLPGLRHSHDKRLQDELARLVDEKATPTLLTSGAASRGEADKGAAHPALADKDNAAVVLAKLFAPGEVEMLDDQTRNLFPQGKFQFDPVALEKAIEFRETYDQPRKKGRAALARPGCDFHLQHARGMLADTSFVEVIRICCRLEAFLAAERLAEDKPDEALEPLSYMFRYLALPAKEKHVIPRLSAAEGRTEALAVLEAIAQHPKASLATHRYLHELMIAQLADWPPDADAWIGDRALGMHTYEWIRDGRLTSVLTVDELARFRKEGNLRTLARAVVRTIDQDELYYLRTMRRIIESCGQPFYQRREIFQDIRAHLQEIRQTDAFPIIAARILLPDIEQAQQHQAKDRAAMEVWALALAAATDGEKPPYEINPLTGEPYRLVSEGTRVVVWGRGKGSADRPVIVPVSK